MADEKTEPIKYWKIKADGIDDIGMFNQCSLPSMSLTAKTSRSGTSRPSRTRCRWASRRPSATSLSAAASTTQGEL